MRAILLAGLVLLAIPCYGQAKVKGTLTARFEESGADIQTAAATWTVGLAIASYLSVDVFNATDCDLELRLTDATNAPTIYIPEGSSASIDFGKFGLRTDSSVDVRKIQADTCSSGIVYIQGMKADASL